MAEPLPPVPQDFYEDNRQTYGAETKFVNLDTFVKNACNHYFVRISYSAVECKYCHMGLIDNNCFILEDGKLTGIK